MPVTTECFTVRLDSNTIAALLADAEAQGTDPATVVEEIITQKYTTRSNREVVTDKSDEFWDDMTEEEKQGEILAVEEGIADCEAGRVLTLEQVIESARVKFGIELAPPRASV